MAEEYSRDGFLITTERAKMDSEAIHEYLSNSYWCKGISLEMVRKFIEHSLCFGVFEDGAQIGFARVVTDYTTLGYLKDVFILESHCGQGLGKWLMECVMAHPQLQALRKWRLATRDAHTLYARYGFTPLAKPGEAMEITKSNI